MLAMLHLILIVLMGLFTLYGYAAEKTVASKPIYLGLGYTNDTITYNLDGEGNRLPYKANTPATIELFGEYGSYGVTVLLPAEPPQSEIKRYGRTSGQNFALSRFEDSWGLDLYYHSNRGFYLEKAAQDPDPRWVVKERLYRPDMRIQSYGINAIYSLFPADFSLRSAFSRSQRSRTWSWSPLALIFHDALAVSSDGDLVPASLEPSGAPFNNYGGGLFTSTGLGIGAGVIIPLDPLSLTFSAIYGRGLELRRYDFGGPDASEEAVAQKYNYRLGIGYSGDEYFAGAGATADIKVTHIKNRVVDYQTNNFELYLGRAF